jgi:hypothetical protein
MTVPFNATTQVGFTRAESLLTVKQLKERYLIGLLDDNQKIMDFRGREIPDATIQHYINAAMSYLEIKLDLILADTTFVEEYDYRQVDYTHFNFIQLKKRPLIDVTEIKARFPNNKDLVTYPKEWYVMEKESSQIQLSPVEGSFSGLIVTQGGSYVPLIYGTRDSWPHLFHVTYRAGFCADQVPVILNEMIGMQASIRMFEILGDVLFGPGVSSESVALDGASVNRALTNAQKYALFSGRILSYKEQMKDYIDTVKRYYSGIPSVII